MHGILATSEQSQPAETRGKFIRPSVPASYPSFLRLRSPRSHGATLPKPQKGKLTSSKTQRARVIRGRGSEAETLRHQGFAMIKNAQRRQSNDRGQEVPTVTAAIELSCASDRYPPGCQGELRRHSESPSSMGVCPTFSSWPSREAP